MGKREREKESEKERERERERERMHRWWFLLVVKHAYRFSKNAENSSGVVIFGDGDYHGLLARGSVRRC